MARTRNRRCAEGEDGAGPTPADDDTANDHVALGCGEGDSGFERFDTHYATTLTQTVFGHQFTLEQSPESDHLGTTVWDSSIVLAKYLEKNAKNGPFSRSALRGARVMELGSGVGLAGMTVALLGPASVTLSDTAELLPLLQRNVDHNLGKHNMKENGLSRQHPKAQGNIPKPKVVELDWCSAPQRSAHGTFDFIVAADCVYHPSLAEALYNTLVEVTHKKSTVLIANEVRSPEVIKHFMGLVSQSFSTSAVPSSQLHPGFTDSAIQLSLLRRKSGKSKERLPTETSTAAQYDLSLWEDLTLRGIAPAVSCWGEDNVVVPPGSREQTRVQQEGVHAGIEDSTWNARRQGSLAARLLKDVVTPVESSVPPSDKRSAQPGGKHEV